MPANTQNQRRNGPALRQREPDGERERIRDAEETTTCAGDDQCSVVPTLPSFVSAVIDSPSTRAAAFNL
jgi:hypothetical protein